jgi:hypothetical protein
MGMRFANVDANGAFYSFAALPPVEVQGPGVKTPPRSTPPSCPGCLCPARFRVPLGLEAQEKPQPGAVVRPGHVITAWRPATPAVGCKHGACAFPFQNFFFFFFRLGWLDSTPVNSSPLLSVFNLPVIYFPFPVH